MFKQKLIPLAGAALFLFSCAKPATTINMNKLMDIKDIKYLSSDKFTAKDGKNYVINMNYSDYDAEHVFSASSAHMILFSNNVEEFSTLVLFKETSSFTYNDKKITKSNLSFDAFYEAVMKGETSVNDTYVVGSSKKYNEDSLTGLLFAHASASRNDKIKISFKSLIDADNVTALGGHIIKL